MLTIARPAATDCLPKDWSPETANRAVEALRSHPDFARAISACVETLHASFSANPMLNAVMNDRGRFLFAAGAIGLHAEADAEGQRLTSARLADFCEEHGVCSRGRAKAMFAVLRWGGHLVPVEPGADRRSRPFAPSPTMVAAVRRRWRGQLVAGAILWPELVPAVERLDEDEAFLFTFAAHLVADFRKGMRILNPTPELAAVGERSSGIPIMLDIHRADRRGDPLPSIAQLSRFTRTSRAHVRGIIKIAAEEGMVAQDEATGSLQVRPLLEDCFARFGASVILSFASAATATLAKT